MDGLTISTANKILETGKTTSEIQKSDLQHPEISKGEKSFADTLKDSIGKVNQLQKESDVLIEKLATGESKNIPEVMIAVEKADIAMKMMVQVRNKIIDAYQEVMKMQV